MIKNDDYVQPYKVVYFDEGNMLRSVFAEIITNNEWRKVNVRLRKSGGGVSRNKATGGPLMPIALSGGLWRKKPEEDNITQYDNWIKDKEKLERFCEIHGINISELSKRKKVQVSEKLLDGADVIYGFTDGEIDELKKRFPQYRNIIKKFSDMSDIKRVDFEDHSTRFDFTKVLETLTSIQAVIQNRRNEIVVKSELTQRPSPFSGGLEGW